MCLYPTLIKNKRYTETKKNGGKIPPILDKRTIYVPVGCGVCMECRKQKSREWQTRLIEHIKTHTNGVFVTLTFNEESLQAISNKIASDKPNEIATEAVKLFLERWRKKHKRSVEHWLITELGHNGTERLHLHGLIFTDNREQIEKIWQYGWVYLGEYVNARTINYIIKYVTKVDNDHKEFTGKILCSPGMGRDYTKTQNFNRSRYNGDKTHDEYVLPNGRKIQMPIYFKNKRYTEEERQQLWIQKLDKNVRYVDGIKIDMSKDDSIKRWYNTTMAARAKSLRLGYGEPTWDYKKYIKTIKKLKKCKKNLQI